MGILSTSPAAAFDNVTVGTGATSATASNSVTLAFSPVGLKTVYSLKLNGSFDASFNIQYLTSVFYITSDGSVFNFSFTFLQPSTAFDLTASVVRSDRLWEVLLSGDDLLTLGDLADNVNLFAGDDYVDAGAGNDVLYGGAGNDVLYGGAGADTLDGGADADTLIGGMGDDTYVVDNAADTDTVTENAGEGIDLVQSSIAYTLDTNIENLTLTGTDNINGTGNALANTLTGNAGNNVLDGGTGADTLIGGAGNDTYLINTSRDMVVETFNNGMDSIQANIPYFNRVSFLGKKIPSQFAPGPTLETPENVENLSALGFTRANLIGNELDNELTGNGADNVLQGMGGNDTLIGGWGRDTLYGGSGNDNIDGGGGQDRLIGGTGSDTFVFSATSDSSAFSLPSEPFVFNASSYSSAFSLPDVITDFEPGTDKIDLSAIDAASGGVDDAFLWGGNNVNTVANSVTWFDDGANTIIRIDNTGDTAAEMQIILSGTGIGLVATHFFL